MTEEQVVAHETAAGDERESTQAIARRMLQLSPDTILRPVLIENMVKVFIRALQGGATLDAEIADLAELLRRAAAGECDPCD